MPKQESEMKTFDVDGKIFLSVSISVEAKDEEEAMKKAKARFADMYHLKARGAFHDPDTDVEYDLDADELPTE